MNEDLRKALFILGKKLQAELDRLTIRYKASGSLHQALTNTANIKIVGKDNNLEIDIKVPKQLEILDFGRKPGKWTPYAPLEAWVNLKLKPEPSRLKATTFAVINKIKKEGMKRPDKFHPNVPGGITAEAKRNAFMAEKENIKKSAGKDQMKLAIDEIKKALIEAKLTQ